MINKLLTLALIQMKVEGGRRKSNLRRAGERIRKAVSAGANMLLLPEAMDLGWTHPSALTEAEEIPEGETSHFLIVQAQHHGVYICSGLIEKEGDQIYNSAVLVDPTGKIILKHRKINELDIGRAYYKTGKDLKICETEFGRIGIIICADAKKAKLLAGLGVQRAEIVLSPCSWAVPPAYDNRRTPYGQEWIDAYSQAAREFSMWIAGCSNVGRMQDGPWQGYHGIGRSLIVNSKGQVARQGRYGVDADEILYQTIDT